MPLRDHFRSPLAGKRSWDALHGMWPAVIVMALHRTLPAEYVAEPRVYLGAAFKIDIAAREAGYPSSSPEANGPEGGVATATWAPPRPTLDVVTEVPEQDEYAVFIRDETQQRRLVAAIEIVSPANKDRAEHRRSFVTKCAALLQQGVSVSIIDFVTARHANLYDDLLTQVGQTDPKLSAELPPIYAAACRWRRGARDDAPWRLQAWAHAFAIGQSLPTLPLWLTEDLAVPLELESTYEEACRGLRIT